jgi:hypothetical protein
MMIKRFVATAVRGSLSVSLAVLGLLSTAVGEAFALDRDIVNAAGFETPSFTTTFLGSGQLEGQANPPGFGQVLSPGVWNMSAGGITTEAVVQNAVVPPVGGGLQAVRVTRSGNSATRWGIPVNNQGYPEYPNTPDFVPPGETAQPCLCISWDMRVNASGGNPLTDFGPFFGVEANDDDTVPLGLLGSLGVDATTGEVLYQAPGTGFLTAAGPIVAFGTWHNYQIKLDYSNDTYTILYDKVPQGTFAFVDNGPGVNLDRFTEANIAALAASGAPADLVRAGTAFFDNFVAREGMCNVIPEPSTVLLALMGFALVPGVARRQRQA